MRIRILTSLQSKTVLFYVLTDVCINPNRICFDGVVLSHASRVLLITFKDVCLTRSYLYDGRYFFFCQGYLELKSKIVRLCNTKTPKLKSGGAIYLYCSSFKNVFLIHKKKFKVTAAACSPFITRGEVGQTTENGDNISGRNIIIKFDAPPEALTSLYELSLDKQSFN